MHNSTFIKKDTELLLDHLHKQVNSIKWNEAKTIGDYIIDNHTPNSEVQKTAGVYVIFNDTESLYVGAAGINHALKNRVKNLLYHHNPYNGNHYNHILSNTMYKACHSFKKIEGYLKKSKIVMISEGDDAGAKTLEHFLISILKPKCNSEINDRETILEFWKAALD